MSPHEKRSTPRQEADRLLLAAPGDGWVLLEDVKMVMRDYVMPGTAHRAAARRRKTESDPRQQDSLTVGKTAVVNRTVGNAIDARVGKWVRSECGTKVRHRDWVPADCAARRRLEALKEMIAEPDVDDLVAAITSLWTAQDWKPLGYPNWDSLVAAELSAIPKLSRELREETVVGCRLAGMSTRAIGAALGVDQKTVVNDLKSGEEYSSPEPQPVTGLDGKTYRPTPKDLAAREKKPRAAPPRKWHEILATSNDPVEMAALIKKHKPEVIPYLAPESKQRNRKRTRHLASVSNMEERRA